MNSILQQFTTMWSRLEASQRVTIVLVGLGFAAAALAISYGVTRPSLRLLARDLAPGRVAEIAAHLDSTNVPYRIIDGETGVMVPEKDLYRLRQEFAERRMLGDGSKGFEILAESRMWDSSFQEQKTYDRAVSGELERSFREINSVRSARVIIDRPAPSPFVGDQSAQPRASIKIDLHPGMRLTDKQVSGIIHLTTGAVAGLNPDRVQVMDGNGLLTPPDANSGAAQAQTALEAEIARENHLTRKAQELLDATLGPGRSKVKVAVKLDFTKRTSASSNPDKSSVLRENTVSSEERTPVFNNGGLAGTASNVEGEGQPTSGMEMAAKTSEETRNEYVVGQTTTTREEEIGSIKGMTVSILLDHRSERVTRKDEAGKEVTENVYTAIDAAERQRIADLVLNAIGYWAARGSQPGGEADQIVAERFKYTVDSIRMYQPPEETTVQASMLPLPDRQLMDWVGYGVAGLFAVGLVVVARGQLSRSHRAWSDAESRARQAAEQRSRLAAQSMGDEPDARARRQELKDAIRQKVQEDPAAAAEIVKTWMSGSNG